MTEFHSLVISEIRKETPNSVSIAFDVPDSLRETFEFLAGQYINIKYTLDGTELRRSYSLCSSPSSGELKVGVKKVKDGTFSKFANDALEVGDLLEVMPPMGHFSFEPNPDNRNVYAAFVAGSGITPVISIIKDVMEREPKSSFLLVYGNQSLQEAMFYDELEALKENYSGRLSVEYIFSRNKENNGMVGRIDRSVVNYLLKNKWGQTEFTRFYLCGPEEMIETVKDTLLDRGVKKEQILFELFSSSEDGSLKEDHEGDTTITITLDDEVETFIMSKKKSVLDAALEHGLDAPFSCQGGICSTCIARITKGKVEMRKNQILTDSELEEGLVLTCQSHPTTSVLEIDYDDV
ncbi:MAG: 2Fe-2S iron-sulfur cluster binding domain-containing protein [Flavobacteriaceae bacterium]|nr:2Fe-2S iron-sulfur cluster binding domain-containing protein [Flavobacteriaceae bacterium]